MTLYVNGGRSLKRTEQLRDGAKTVCVVGFEVNGMVTHSVHTGPGAVQ
jgi:hypothetical protein